MKDLNSILLADHIAHTSIPVFIIMGMEGAYWGATLTSVKGVCGIRRIGSGWWYKETTDKGDKRIIQLLLTESGSMWEVCKKKKEVKRKISVAERRASE